MPRPVRFYFDFVSVYSWLAAARAEAFAREHAVRFELRPILYAGLLDRVGGVGTGEDPRRRAHAFRDAQRIAHGLGLPFVAPPVHPFVSLAALRLQTAACLDQPERALALARALFAAAWEQGRDLTDAHVLAEAAAGAGVTVDAARAQSPEVKRRLIEWGDEAFDAGLFGVPTFVAPDGELFYGQDRLPDLALHLDGGGPAAYLAEPPLGTPRAAVAAREAQRAQEGR